MAAEQEALLWKKRARKACAEVDAAYERVALYARYLLVLVLQNDGVVRIPRGALRKVATRPDLRLIESGDRSNVVLRSKDDRAPDEELYEDE